MITHQELFSVLTSTGLPVETLGANLRAGDFTIMPAVKSWMVIKTEDFTKKQQLATFFDTCYMTETDGEITLNFETNKEYAGAMLIKQTHEHAKA